MRGKNYDPGKRRVFPNGGYFALIAVIVVLAALVAVTLLVVLPATESPKDNVSTIVSINYPDEEIGAGSDLSRVYVTVTYSDGKTESVALSSMVHEGLDVTKSGKQTVSVSYGGFEGTLPITVKNVNCQLTYSASDGGSVIGGTNDENGRIVQSVISGGDADTVIAVPETGYKFIGWSDGYPYAQRRDTGVNESRNLIANFDKEQFTVVFFFNDGTTAKEQKVLYNEKPTDIPDHNDPKMRVYGYTFRGWSVSEEDYAHVTRDMNIYPRYEKTATDVTVEVSKDRNGNVMGSTDVNECGYYAHSETEKAKIVATPDNSREFNNWAVLSSDGTYVSLGKDSKEETIVEIGDKRTKVAFRVSSEDNTNTSYSVSFLCNENMAYVSLKAEFAYASSSVSFVNYQNKNTNNLECTVDDVLNNQGIGDKIKTAGATRPDGKPAKIDDDPSSPNYGLIVPDDVYGMTFVGWYMQGDPEQNVVDRYQTFVEPSTLVAKWEKKEYTLYFVYDDESGIERTYGERKVMYQNTVGSGGGIPVGTPTKDRYIFTGWQDALALTTVDDTTQIIMNDKYDTGADSLFMQGKIKIRATWTPVPHKLSVETDGNGAVKLFIKEKGSATPSEEYVLGERTIYEDRTYEVSFIADEDYVVDSVQWTYGDVTETYADNKTGATGFVVELRERYDNSIRVSFKLKEYTVTIRNGNEVTKGIITASGGTYDEETVKITVGSGASFLFGIQSSSDLYSIEKVKITGRADGKVYNDETKVDFGGSEDVSEYTVTLDKIYSDVDITIEYKGRNYTVTVNQKTFIENGETVYPIMETEYGGRADEYKVPGAGNGGQTEYGYGTRIFYAMRAPKGSYISSVLFNGVNTDLYSVSYNVFFYDWEINGVKADIELKRINDAYYYSYGSRTIGGRTYFLCDDVFGGETVVFEQTGDEYVPTDGTAPSEESGLTIKEYLEKVLDAASRRISDSSVGKDNRVTAVKCAFLPDKNTNVAIAYGTMEYSFVVKESEFGSVDYTATKVAPGATVTVTATPITGYKITGYTINGEYKAFSSLDVKERCVVKVENVTEDKTVEIIYEPVKYNLVIANVNRNGRIFVVTDEGEKEVVGSLTFSYEYATGGKFVIKAESGKVIKSITIDGEEQTVVRNAEEYVYTDYRFSRDVKIEVECGDKLPFDAGASGYTVEFADGNNVAASVEYDKGNKNVLLFVAEKGYSIDKITVAGKKGGVDKTVAISDFNAVPSGISVSLVKNADGTVKQATVSLALDEFDGVATASYVSSPLKFNLTVRYGTDGNDGQGGTVTGAGVVYYGKTASVSVGAEQNYYVSSFKVDGEEVSFVNKNWTSKTSSSYAGKYTDGEYEFVVYGDCEIEVEFSLFTYRVTLDENSVNGETTLSTDGNRVENGVLRVNHGGKVTVSMKAAAGYHISRILINGVEMADYKPITDVANDNGSGTYVYLNAKGDVSVYVVYEINRYSFRYSLINGSENFASQTETGNKLDCPDATKIGDDTFGGIAYGDNFSFIVTAGENNGYYVYSVRIKYSGYKDEERIRYFGDGFSADGGTIWFSKFLWGNSSAGSVGVTADIELIEIVFKKKTFAVTFNQLGEPGGGTVAFSVANSLSPEDGVIVFDRENATDESMSIYRFIGGKIYKKQSDGSFALTSIALTYIGGEWKFYDETEGKEYTMYFEYGLRCTVTVAPTEGYERSAFTVNGDDRAQSVYNDRYSFNVYRQTAVVVEYKILVFEVSLKEIAYGSKMNEISERETSSYATAKLYKVETVDGKAVETLLAEIEKGTSSFSVIVDYGTLIKIVITPNFAERGAYLFNLQENNSQLTITGDATATITYGGDGKKTVEDLSYKATFKIMEYRIKTVTAYEEDIKGETRNVFAGDATSAVSWKTFWNTSADIRIIAGTGYYVKAIVIVYTENGTEKTITIDYPSAGTGDEEQNYVIDKDREDPIYGKRDMLTLLGVKSDYTVTAYFARNEYNLTYEFAVHATDKDGVNKSDYIDFVKSELNERNSVYPQSSHADYTFKVRHYDELTGTITPVDGYAIAGTKITVRYYEDGEAKEREFTLTKTGSGDEVTFTFHRLSMPVTDFYVYSDVMIIIDPEIKRYSLGTSITRTAAAGDTSANKNDTAVTLRIRDKAVPPSREGNKIVVNGAEQGDEEFTAGIVPKVTVAEHHGYFVYEFTTPSGYIMSDFTVNGYSLNGLKKQGIIETDGYSCEKIFVGDDARYKYRIKINVVTALIDGSTDPWIKINDINVSMDFTPIQYKVKIIVNGELLDFRSINGQVGVTDGKTINVYAATASYHFGVASISPVMYEGYRIGDLRTNAYFGTEDDYVSYRDKSEYKVGAALINNRTVISDFTPLRFVSAGLKNADASKGVTVVYFEFNTEIITYKQEIETNVYYSNKGKVEIVPLSQNNAAGTVTVTRMTGSDYVNYDLNADEKYEEIVEYFTVISVEATVKSGFALYGIYEGITDRNGKTDYSRIISGTRNVTYAIEGNVHKITIIVKDLSGETLGNRKFRFDFKQQSEISLTVANPYKYVSSTRRYASYVAVEAYSSEYAMESGKPSASDIIANTNVVSGETVVETYRFTVYVGNYVKFIVTDTYQNAAPVVRFYDSNLSLTATDPFADEGIKNLGESGYGEMIAYETIDYYAYVGTEGRITTTKSTVGAISSTSGGTIAYNKLPASTAQSVVLSDASTVAGKTVTIKVTPAENYAFYQLRARQPLKSESRKKGYIVYGSTDETQWTSIAFDQIGEEVSNDRFAGTNGFRLVSSKAVRNALGEITSYEFEIWVCGDAEFEVEFYRTYKLSLGIYMTDKVAQYGTSSITSDGISFVGTISDVAFETSIVNGGNRLSYSANFNITAVKPEGNYQFVGWYVNNYNTFEYLGSLLPDDSYLEQRITVFRSEMPSLISDGTEVSELTVYAVFQPIIDVMIYNEKYYAYEDHFNSWNLGTVLASYYDFKDGQPIVSDETSLSVYDNKGKTIPEAIDYLSGAGAYKYADASGNKGLWSTLLTGKDATAGYSDEMKQNKVYTSYKEFTTLFQNITNSDYLSYSWQDTEIKLNTSGMSATAQFDAWQYYNWNENKWQNIAYRYRDSSMMSAGGSATIIDCYFSSYSLNLNALYALDGGASVMPYAISATNANNLVRNASDAANVRPLLIRPDFYQTITVDVSQNLYSTDLGDEDPEQTVMSESLVRGRISTVDVIEPVPGRSGISDSGKQGTFEYGSTISLVNNAFAPGEDVYNESKTIRYRFLGWFMKYDDVLYYLKNSEADESGAVKAAYDIMLTCKSNTPETAISVIALYVAQYKQSVYSYNVSGGSAENYLSSTAGKGSYDASPVLTITSPTDEQIVFESFDLTATKKLNYTAADVVKYYWINGLNGNRVSGEPGNEGNEFVKDGREFDYYFDAGLTYKINVKKNAETGLYAEQLSADDMKANNVGFCPETDTLYKYMKNRTEELADYSAYYNSGKATYYGQTIDETGTPSGSGHRAYTAKQMNDFAFTKIGEVHNTKDDSTRSNQYDLMYVSTATLLFYNLTYKGGVTVTKSLASAISGGKTEVLTVWDENTQYGDYKEITADGTPVALGANGEVVIRVTLIKVIDEGFMGRFAFAFAGMENGEGFPTDGDVAGPGERGLFSSSRDETKNGRRTFTRWLEVDMSSIATTRLFGDDSSTAAVNPKQVGDHASTPAVYTTENAGDPIKGYKINSTAQLKSIELFWKNNAYSCVGVINPSDFRLFDDDGKKIPIWEDEATTKYTANYAENYGRTKFILKEGANYALQTGLNSGLTNNPVANSIPWTPLCDDGERISSNTRYVWGSNYNPERNGGFDGILEGNNAIISGIAVKSVGTDNFGLFAIISGGVVRNLTFDNAYINVGDGMNIGLLAGSIEYSKVTGIKFEKKSNMPIYSSPYVRTATAGARTYIVGASATNVGALAGQILGSIVEDISFDIGANFSMEVSSGDSAGLLAGLISGDDSAIGSISLTGSGGWLFVGTGDAEATYAGGLIGTLEDGAVVRGVKVEDDVNMFIGGETNTVASGGVVGTIKTRATLTSIAFSGYKGDKSDNFSYNPDSGKVDGKGIFIFASTTGGYGTNAITGTSVGKAGGLVGYNNQGYVINTPSDSVTGVFKIHAGFIGGIVGANRGRVSGFALGTGHTASGYNGVTVLAWIDDSDKNYAVGGIVGANAHASSTKTTPIDGGSENKPEFTINRNYTGIVDDCSVIGIDALGVANNVWNVGNVYAFLRQSSQDNSYLNNVDKSQATGNLPYTYKHNLMMGGIVGYNKGSVLNSFVKKTKLTFGVNHNATDKASSAEPLNRTYSWGIEAGLIVGYHDPDAKANYGWGNILFGISPLDASESGSVKSNVSSALSGDALSYRIQSCYSVDSVVAVVGRVWMDNPSAWTNSSASGIESLKCEVGLGGIAGATGKNGYAEFSINTCYSNNNKLYYDVNANGDGGDRNGPGFTSGEIPKNSGKWFSDNKTTWIEVRHPFYKTELYMGTYVGGIDYSQTNNGNVSTYNMKGTATGTYYNDGGDTKSQDDYKKFRKDKWSYKYSSTFSTRWMRYNNSINNEDKITSVLPNTNGGACEENAKFYYEDTTINASFDSISGDTNKIELGVIRGTLAATDIETGMLKFCVINGKTLMQGSVIPNTEYEVSASLRANFLVNGTEWVLYDYDLFGNKIINPTASAYSVRGMG